MKSAVQTNGVAKENSFTKALLIHYTEADSAVRLTVQQALCKWYNLFNQKENFKCTNGSLFSELSQDELLNSLQTDIELVPSVLMDEFISNTLIQDKGQYIRLVQALLINLSDNLYLKQDEFTTICHQIENSLLFIQNFFYQQFDADSRLTKFYLWQFAECCKLKFDYWHIKLNGSPLIDALQECLTVNFISPENSMTFRKTSYLKYLLQEIESATTVISEDYVRELFIYNNFNSTCFISHEIELVKTKLNKFQTNQEVISFLQAEQTRIIQLKIKSGSFYDNQQPSIKKQLSDWITEEIKQLEVKNRKAADKDLMIDPESKIQTSLSVAKLAVLIRLMVADKIIINKTVAPMLRTVTKLFTTLQKDEISFGSLETKYHAPDKTTLNTMKEMMQKWVGILGKL
jgi:hypothetical protein